MIGAGKNLFDVFGSGSSTTQPKTPQTIKIDTVTQYYLDPKIRDSDFNGHNSVRHIIRENEINKDTLKTWVRLKKR